MNILVLSGIFGTICAKCIGGGDILVYLTLSKKMLIFGESVVLKNNFPLQERRSH